MIEKFLAKAMSSGLNSPATGQRMDAPDDESEFEQFKWLGKYTPCFEIDSAKIEIMQTPAEFYDNLKVGRVVVINVSNHCKVVDIFWFSALGNAGQSKGKNSDQFAVFGNWPPGTGLGRSKLGHDSDGLIPLVVFFMQLF